jgi:hypothetical protein
MPGVKQSLGPVSLPHIQVPIRALRLLLYLLITSLKRETLSLLLTWMCLSQYPVCEDQTGLPCPKPGGALLDGLP